MSLFNDYWRLMRKFNRIRDLLILYEQCNNVESGKLNQHHALFWALECINWEIT